MAGIEAIAAVGNVGAADGAAPVAMQLGLGAPATAAAGEPSFGEVLMAGLKGVDAKVANAETMAQKFAVDDSIPVHQVTMALAEARVSVELAMQVRARLVEGYRELMNMQI